MLWFLILILPSSACLFCFLHNIFLSRRTNTFLIFQIVLAVTGILVFAESLFTAPTINVIARIIVLVAAPSLIPLAWMYLFKLNGGSRFASWQYLWLAIPLLFLITGILLLDLAGSRAVAVFLDDLYLNGSAAASSHKGDAVYYYYIITIVIFRGVIAIEAAGALGYLVWYIVKEKMSPRDLSLFIRKGASCSVLELQLFNFVIPLIIVLAKALTPYRFQKEYVWIVFVLAVITTLSILGISFTALFGARGNITKRDMELRDILDRRIPEQETEPETEQETDEYQNASALSMRLFATMAGTWDEESLLARFQKLVVKDKLFLQPGTSIVEIADRLHTNKTYVSKLVNSTYNMGFPELLNSLRIDYAEQYILTHKGAKQDEIAEACGFLSASSFNSIFKKITGMTPGMWIAANTDKKERYGKA